jgi:hypothetical protein
MQADIDQNEADSDAADAAMQADIDQNEADSDAADATQQADIDQNEIDSDAADAAIRIGAGLEADGTYTADSTSNYLTEATSLYDADRLLDNALKAESDARIQADILMQADIDQNTNDINRNREGIAMVAAMTHTTLLPGNDASFDFGVGYFESETAYSLNFARRVKEGVQVNLSAASTSSISDAVVRGSIGFQW